MMEIQLQELIDQIKKDGVEAAQSEADAILAAARAEAESIIADAKQQADKLISDAKSETQRMVKSGEDAILQAGRNLLLSFRESIARELRIILNQKVGAVYTSEHLTALIAKTIECWAEKSDTEELAVILNTEDLKALEEAVLAELKDKIQKGITLKASDSFDGGFRIAKNGEDAFYDYSQEAVVDMLSKYLSPKVAQILKEA